MFYIAEQPFLTIIMGNSFLESINRGLEKDFRANITGDIAVCTIPPKGTMVDVFGASTMEISSEAPQIPALVDIDRVEQIIAETVGIEKHAKMISGQVLLSKGLEFDFSAIICSTLSISTRAGI